MTPAFHGGTCMGEETWESVTSSEPHSPEVYTRRRPEFRPGRAPHSGRRRGPLRRRPLARWGANTEIRTLGLVCKGDGGRTGWCLCPSPHSLLPITHTSSAGGRKWLMSVTFWREDILILPKTLFNSVCSWAIQMLICVSPFIYFKFYS